MFSLANKRPKPLLWAWHGWNAELHQSFKYCLVVQHRLEAVQFNLLHCPCRSARGCHKWLTFSSIPRIRVVSCVFLPVAFVSWLLWLFFWFRSVRACLRLVNRAIVRLRRRRSRLMRENFWRKVSVFLRKTRRYFYEKVRFSPAQISVHFDGVSNSAEQTKWRRRWGCDEDSLVLSRHIEVRRSILLHRFLVV